MLMLRSCSTIHTGDPCTNLSHIRRNLTKIKECTNLNMFFSHLSNKVSKHIIKWYNTGLAQQGRVLRGLSSLYLILENFIWFGNNFHLEIFLSLTDLVRWYKVELHVLYI